MGDLTKAVSDESFKADVLDTSGAVLVDFWAEWCGPCRMLAPTIDALAADYEGRVKVGKLNVDQNGGATMRYGIRGIPALILFKDGQVVAQKVGAVSKGEIAAMLDAAL